MTDPIQELEALYAELPTIECKGLCQNSCGPIDMSDAERKRIVDLGMEIPLFTHERSQAWANGAKLYCPALSFGTEVGFGCSVYEARPLICRVWGLGEGELACPHGCEPSQRLTNGDVMRLVMRAMQIGGKAELPDLETQEVIARLMEDPEHQALIERLMQGDKSVLPQIQTDIENMRREI